MGKYNIGDVWWTHFPFENSNIVKHRPAIVINDDEIAILAMYVTSKDKETPYSIEITDWEQTGLSKVSWARIDRIISISEWNLDRKIGKLTERDLLKILQLVAEITTETFHEFSLAAIKNNNRFLQIYDNRWKCWLFPYFRSTQNNNKENIDLKSVEQIVDGEQINTIGMTIKFIEDKYSGKDLTVERIVDEIEKDLTKSLIGIDNIKGGNGSLAMPRKQEILCAINRLRTLKIKE